MIVAYTYTHHNTLVAMLAFFAVLALIALIVRQVELRRHRELPYGIRPITEYQDSKGRRIELPSYIHPITQMQRTPINLADEYAIELGNVLRAELLEDMSRTLLGPPRMINAWEDLMEGDWDASIDHRD